MPLNIGPLAQIGEGEKATHWKATQSLAIKPKINPIVEQFFFKMKILLTKKKGIDSTTILKWKTLLGPQKYLKTTRYLKVSQQNTTNKIYIYIV